MPALSYRLWGRCVPQGGSEATGIMRVELLHKNCLRITTTGYRYLPHSVASNKELVADEIAF